MSAEDFQNVPKNWTPANFYHGLGFQWVSSLIRVPRPPARMTAFMEMSDQSIYQQLNETYGQFYDRFDQNYEEKKKLDSIYIAHNV